MSGTFWAFVPAIVAIALALLTKQVYLSLFIGIFVGGLFLAGGNPVEALGVSYSVMSEKVGSNVPILVFLVVLGIFVVLLQKSGGAKSYGEWAQQRIRSKKGALLATAGLGCLIFVDDYFNCLTVGSVMRPVTDKFKVSHAKLAWIIDSTAAPVCIIAPISSWAAAVSGELAGNGLVAFIKTIPFNVYALLTIIMVFVFCAHKIDFGKMKKNERAADFLDDLNAGETDLPTDEDKSIKANPNGKVRHLIIPVITLIVCCILGMIYTGYFYDWNTGTLGTAVQSSNLIEAFSNCESGLSLAIGSTVALVIVAAYYMISKIVRFKDVMESLVQGFKTMVPAIFILVFAWTISGVMGAKGGYLDARGFVETNVAGLSVKWLFPALFFILACAIAFATGTSWGTFGVLVPLAIAVLGDSGTLAILTVSATLGGAVYGDHVSPISDTTILASAGGNCNHVDHVKTQLPYASLVAAIAFVSYLVGGIVAASDVSGALCGLVLWAVAAVLFVGAILLIRYLNKKKDEDNTAPAVSENGSAE
ncbi:MAG: Na+/H+ antiporter NhaC family protein [Clostridia bacterium]|nr:Na+/H+ antiporter NhaC family protein [Clostridia bacterium]